MSKLTLLIPYFFVFISMKSAPGFLPIFYNETVLWCVYTLLLLGVYIFTKKKRIKKERILTFYLFWLLLSVIRGTFTAEGYFEYKSLIKYTFALLIPSMIYAFEEPKFVQYCLRHWLKVVAPLFFIIYFFILSDSYYFFYAPAFLIMMLYPYLPSKWKKISIALCMFILVYDTTARSAMMKSIATIGFILMYQSRHIFTDKVLKIIHSFLIILPIILLTLGISGVFNVFQIKEDLGDKELNRAQSIDEGLMEDSRTFIYVNVIESAVNHNYILWGRTPCRGNDDAVNAEKMGLTNFIRDYNEVNFPNIFTWLGLIGLIPFVLLYIKASYKAVYKSNSYPMKIVGLFVAFHWFLGWIEDSYEFNMMTITNWMAIGMCLSQKFLNMCDKQIKEFTIRIFDFKDKSLPL